jgi:hypothetical protein
VSYEWFPSTALDNPNIANPTTNITTNISYILTVTDFNTCKNTDIVNINILPLPLAPTLSLDTAYCFGDTISAIVAQGMGTQINWYDNALLSNIVATSNNYTPSVSIGENIFYASDVLNGCEGPVDSVNIFIHELPNANFTVTHNSLSLIFSPTISSLPFYSWSFGDGNTSSDESPSHTFLSENTYSIGLSVIDNNGCENSTNQDILVLATNINTNFNSKNINIYPNPANNFITIDFNEIIGKTNLIIVDLLGKKVLEQEFNNTPKEIINIENLSNGIYTLRITDAALNSFNYKIIKN